MIISIYIVLLGKSKKEMRAIYLALNAVFLKYATISKSPSQLKDEINSDRRMSATKIDRKADTVLSYIIHRICPACRVARTGTAKYLSFAQVLRCITGTQSLTHSLTHSLDPFLLNPLFNHR